MALGHAVLTKLLHVPLLIKLPGLRDAGAEVETQVQGIDVAPTILAAAGIDPPDGFDGREIPSYVQNPPQTARPAVVWR